MRVKVANRTYSMSRKEYQGLLKVASEQIPFGIYAVEKKDYAELRADRVSSMTKLKELTRAFNQQGFKVYSNKGLILKETAAGAAQGGLMSAT